MPSLDHWRQAIDHEAVRRGVFVNNTVDFWEWMQLKHYKRPSAEFSEAIANKIFDDMPFLIPAYQAYKKSGR